MSAERTETVWLDAHCEVSFAFLERIRALEAELRALRAQLPHRVP